MTSLPAPIASADLEHRPTLFLVYTVHLDTQWRWTIQDTIRDFLPATLDGNFALLEEYPDGVLSFEGAFRYQLMEEYYPEDFERLRELVEARQLAARRRHARLPGRQLRGAGVAAAPHPLRATLLRGEARRCERRPLPARLLRLRPRAADDCRALRRCVGFSAQKFGNWGAAAELPFHVGRWLGPDGEGGRRGATPGGLRRGSARGREPRSSGGATHRAAGRGERPRRWRSCTSAWAIAAGDSPRSSLAWIDQSVTCDGPVQVVQTGSDQLFRTLTAEQLDALPVHRGELLLPTHGTGCWTSQAAAKRWNRACETRAGEAERAASLASWLGVMEYPADQLREAWQRFLWHQMHDDLTGTSIPEAYRFTWNDQLISLNQFETVLEDALQASAGGLDTRGPGLPVVVFNPLERERCDVVEADLHWPGAPLRIEAPGPAGEILPVQVLEHDAERVRLVFAPRLPSLGLSVWHLRPSRKEGDPTTDLEVSDGRMANRDYELAIDEAGEIVSLVDRRTGSELMEAPFRLELLPDRSTRWPAWEIHHRDVSARPVSSTVKARVALLERGPVRAVIEVRRRFRGSTDRQRISLMAADAGARIEFEHEIDWRTRGRLLKVALRQSASSREAIYGLGCGTIRRGTNTPAKYEVPGLWAAPAKGCADGSPPLALIAEGQAGWDHPDPQTLRLSLLRSPRVFRKFRHQGVQDHGRHTIRYALLPHRDPGETDEHAIRFASRPRAFGVPRHRGALGKSVSLLEVGAGVAARAIKQRENGSGLVVRLQESSGVSTEKSILSAPAGPTSVRRLNGCEDRTEEDGRAAVPEDPSRLRLPPFGLATLAVELTSPAAALEPPRYASVTRRGTPRDLGAGRAGFPPPAYPLGALARHAPGRRRAVPPRAGYGEQPVSPPRPGDRLEGGRCGADLLAASADRRRSGLSPDRLARHVGGSTAEIDAGRGHRPFKGTRPGLRHRGGPSRWWIRRDHRIGWVGTHLHDEAGSTPLRDAYHTVTVSTSAQGSGRERFWTSSRCSSSPLRWSWRPKSPPTHTSDRSRASPKGYPARELAGLLAAVEGRKLDPPPRSRTR